MRASLNKIIALGGLAKLVLMVSILMSTLGFVWYHSVSGLPDHKDAVELIFSHRLHVQDQGFECTDCHTKATESQAGTDNLIPSMEVCADCHDVEDVNNCGTCHTNPDEPKPMPRIETYSAKFSHKRHIDANLKCEDCHGGMEKAKDASVKILPDMVKCMDCHDQHALTNIECTTCHLPSDRLVPISHGPDFIHAHSDIARTNATVNGDKTCQTCHDVSYCQKCHEGDNIDRLSHPLNYAFTHALDAQNFERTCVTCHTDRQFCVDCHASNQVLPRSHVPGFVNNIKGDGGRHVLEAENDIESCMSCHESNAEEICQRCHTGRP